MSNHPPFDPLQPFDPPQPYSPSQPSRSETGAAVPLADPASDPPAPSPNPLGPLPPSAPGQSTFRPGKASLPSPGTAPETYPPTSQFSGHPAQPSGYPPQSDFEPPAAPNYGPPGYPPPGQGAMQPGYDPPQPPPKRSNAPLIALILAVTVLLCGGAATAGVLIVDNVADRAKAIEPITDPALPTSVPELPTEAPDLPGLPTGLPTDLPDLPNLTGNSGKKITVVYEVTGDGPAEIVYTEKLGDSPQRVGNAKLPWKITTTMEGSAFVSVTAIRTEVDAGTISCRATVDGEQVAQRTSEGTIATASCSKVIIN